jgi:hypothetical protein
MREYMHAEYWTGAVAVVDLSAILHLRKLRRRRDIENPCVIACHVQTYMLIEQAKLCEETETSNGARAPWNSFFERFKNGICKFKKIIGTKNIDVDNYGTCKCAKSQSKTYFGLIKNNKSIDLVNSE